MLHEKTLEMYRNMSPTERFQLTQEMIRENTPYLLMGTPEQVQKRFELLRRQNDEENRLLAEGFARAKTANERR